MTTITYITNEIYTNDKHGNDKLVQAIQQITNYCNCSSDLHTHCLVDCGQPNPIPLKIYYFRNLRQDFLCGYGPSSMGILKRNTVTNELYDKSQQHPNALKTLCKLSWLVCMDCKTCFKLPTKFEEHEMTCKHSSAKGYIGNISHPETTVDTVKLQEPIITIKSNDKNYITEKVITNDKLGSMELSNILSRYDESSYCTTCAERSLHSHCFVKTENEYPIELTIFFINSLESDFLDGYGPSSVYILKRNNVTGKLFDSNIHTPNYLKTLCKVPWLVCTNCKSSFKLPTKFEEHERQCKNEHGMVIDESEQSLDSVDNGNGILQWSSDLDDTNRVLEKVVYLQRNDHIVNCFNILNAFIQELVDFSMEKSDITKYDTILESILEDHQSMKLNSFVLVKLLADRLLMDGTQDTDILICKTALRNALIFVMGEEV
ncbi:hypothetical protein HDV06_006073 [Boothiomyces sp. JEL0866]|nr:hypothetical protein HDV06_006023 [Boothiomyces sp. JEL0866]KAJ3324815.1 hypothetical protein HDV06_006073 [Boothiomyces sp. JEL0866]